MWRLCEGADDMMTRREELLKIVRDHGGAEAEAEAERLVDEIVFVEDQLVEVKKLPFISANPANPAKQKATPAARLYKELLQQYNNSLKLLMRLAGDTANDKSVESPLRAWAKGRKELNT